MTWNLSKKAPSLLLNLFQTLKLFFMIKKILLAIAGILVLLVIVGFFLPSASQVNRTVTIHAPVSAVFEEVNNLENWKNWSYWQSLDPEMKMTFGEKKEGTGASYSWDGPETGKGSLSITESIPDKSIRTELQFTDMGAAVGRYEFTQEGETTTVKESFTYEYGANVLMRYMGKLFMEGEVGKAFEVELARIKEIAEAKPAYAIKITEESFPGASYIGMSHKMSPKDAAAISAQMGKMYGDLLGAVTRAKVQMTGAPFCLYPAFNDETMEMICALPVGSEMKTVGKFKVEQLPSGPVVKAVHYGSYDKLIDTHQEIGKYIQVNMLAINGAHWETYVTDPMAEKDTAKWVTEVYYPIRK